MLLAILVSLSGTLVFLLPFSSLWYFSLITISFFAGLFVSSVGFYIKHYCEAEYRHKVAADVLIYSNIIMIIINVVTVNLSIKVGLFGALLILILALFVALQLEAQPNKELNNKYSLKEDRQLPGILKPFLVLCLFITIITINSGFMYQVVTPAYSHLEVLASYYWAVPYILALWILRNLPTNINKAYILFIAMTMIGISYIAFMWLEPTVTSYLIIDTLMLGAFGVCDLFWWSILMSFFDYHYNAARVLGIGLSMNVLGVLIGGYIGNRFLIHTERFELTSMIALIIIFIVLILLPLLNNELTRLFRSHIFLVALVKKLENKDESPVMIKPLEQLTDKEKEVVELLLKGYTYKGIAERLFISENTMKFHIKNIYQKLNINSKMELIKLITSYETKNK
jgi:DNA-binding CsgD family transcriptional regulator